MAEKLCELKKKGGGNIADILPPGMGIRLKTTWNASSTTKVAMTNPTNMASMINGVTEPVTPTTCAALVINAKGYSKLRVQVNTASGATIGISYYLNGEYVSSVTSTPSSTTASNISMATHDLIVVTIKMAPVSATSVRVTISLTN